MLIECSNRNTTTWRQVTYKNIELSDLRSLEMSHLASEIAFISKVVKEHYVFRKAILQAVPS